MERRLDIEALFAEALELDPAERAGLFERVRRTDPAAAERLEAYVAVLESRPEFLTTPPEIPVDDLGDLVGSPPDRNASRAGSLAFLAARERVAGYELVRVIGYGGMGVVYEAIQQQPRRRVALKLLRATDAGPGVQRRFEAEAEILARLRDPAIAQVYEAGVTTVEGEAIPYLAMELIHDAKTIVDHARERALDRDARLRLFCEVAAAVEHAHEQGVIHRDLKPANILVDDTGRPKVIDFGIARIVEGEDATLAATQTRGVLGTIAYMSPEQLGSDRRPVDRRTDVYALGVVLYELMCGAMPYDVDRSSLPGAVRAVVHDPPVALSARAGGGARVPRDLDTIVLKALRKTREDRYDSVAAFADDVRRLLDHEPIAARPPSLTYRMRLLSRRRPGLVATVAVAATLIAVGVGISGWLWARGERLERQAEDARDELRRVREALGSDGEAARSGFEPFASGILSSVEESLAAAADDEERARLLTWAVDTLARLEPEGETDPELLSAIGETYLDLGDAYGSEWEAGPEKVTGAVRAQRRAAEIFAALVARDPDSYAARDALVRSRIRLAQTYRKLSRMEAAYETADLAVADANRMFELRPEEARPRLITALWARGDARIGVGSAEAGLDDSVRAEELAAALVERDPESIRGRYLLAWSSFRVGAWTGSDPDSERSALAAHARANDQRLELVDLAPEIADISQELLAYSAVEVDLRARLEGPGPAAERLRRFLDGAAVAARTAGTEVDVAYLFAQRSRRLATLLVEAGRDDEARSVADDLLDHLDAIETREKDPERVLPELRDEVRAWAQQLPQ